MRKNSTEDVAIAPPVPTWKRMMDIAASIVAMAVLSPVFLAVAVITKAASPGPILYKQKRIGRAGKAFTLWKFRTMHPDVDQGIHKDHLSTLLETDSPMTKLDVGQDTRVFPAGRIIRRLYLDELPQLVNVLRGEMSIVGPRPSLPYDAEWFKPWQRARFQALPGMTGLWQVSGKNKTTYTEMIHMDIAYVKQLSVREDIRIIAKTIPVIALELLEQMQRRAARDVSAEVARKNT